MNAKIRNVITAVLSATLLASCAIQPGVTESTELTTTTEVTTSPTTETEVTSETTQKTKGIPQFPEFNADYETSDPSIG